MASSSLCARCNSFSEWYLDLGTASPGLVTNRDFTEMPLRGATSTFSLYATYESLKASARAECALCDLLCYDISLFPIRNYRSRGKIPDFDSIGDNVDAYLRTHTGHTRVELRCLIGPSRSSSYGIKYRIGDSSIAGGLSFGDIGKFLLDFWRWKLKG
jgi:hypothetical protein